MGGWLYPDEPGGGFLPFLIFTVILGGAGAWATGRAFAGTWRSAWLLPAALVALAIAVRFLHYALTGTEMFPAQEDLLSVPYFIVALVIGALFAGLGYRKRRVEQMTGQYPWIFGRSGTLGWTARDGA